MAKKIMKTGGVFAGVVFGVFLLRGFVNAFNFSEMVVIGFVIAVAIISLHAHYSADLRSEAEQKKAEERNAALYAQEKARQDFLKQLYAEKEDA